MMKAHGGRLWNISARPSTGTDSNPQRKDNVDTYKYFGDPVYIYSLKEGINDGFLTPFKVKQISTTGGKYTYTSDDDVIEGEVEEGKVYGIEEQNRIIELMDIERFRVQTFMDMIDQSKETRWSFALRRFMPSL